MKSRIILSLVMLCISVHRTSAETIGMEEFFKALKKNHPYYQKERFNSPIEQAEQRSLSGARDLYLSAKPYHIYSEPLVGFDPIRVKKSTGYGLALGAAKKLWLTGASVSVEWEALRQRYTLTDTISNETYRQNDFQHSIKVGFKQPLMQNAFGILDRLEYRLKGVDGEIARIQALENNEDFLLQHGQKYLQWVFLNEQHSIAENRSQLAERSHERNVRMYNASLIERIDLMRSQEESRSAKQSLIESRAELDALKIELAYATGNKSFHNATPGFSLYSVPEIPLPADATAFLEKNSRVLVFLTKNMEKLRLEKKAWENASLPDVSLHLSGDLHKNNRRWSKAARPGDREVYIGMEVSYPIGNNAAAGKNEKAELEIKQLELEISGYRRNISAQADSLLHLIGETRKLMDIHREQVRRGAEKSVEEARRYNRGKGNYYFIVESRNQEQTYRLLYAQNALRYHQLLLHFKALTDQLLIQH